MLLSLRNFVFTSFIIFEKNSKKARLKKSSRKMRMVSRSWQNCLEGPKNCPQGRGFCLFFCPEAIISQKFSARGAGNLTTLKNSPGVSPEGCWCLELTDALCTCIQLRMTKHPSRKVMKFSHLLGCDTIVDQSYASFYITFLVTFSKTVYCSFMG